MKTLNIEKLESRLNQINRKEYAADGKLNITKVSYLRNKRKLTDIEITITLADGTDLRVLAKPNHSIDYIAGYVDCLLLQHYTIIIDDADGDTDSETESETETPDGDTEISDDPDGETESGETWLNV